MRILLILLFISFNGFSQTYNEIMSIKDADSFKKVVILNNYEALTEERINDLWGDQEDYPIDSMVSELETTIRYTYNSYTHYASWFKEDDTFQFEFTRTLPLLGVIEDNPYDNLLKEVKKNCKYYKIITTDMGYDFITYGCSQSLYKGKIGFMISDDKGIVVTLIED